MAENWIDEIRYPSNAEETEVDDHPEDVIERILVEWLLDKNADSHVLLNWCEGVDLPGVGHNREPYEWLLRGIPLDETIDQKHSRDEIEEIFATRVKRILEERPDTKSPGSRPNQLLYNLFMLCSGLQRPDELSEILYVLFKDRKVQGDWLGSDVKGALLSALITNQSDDRLWEELWKPVLDGEHDYLPAAPPDAFHGVRLMPKPLIGTAKAPFPPIDEIGYSMKKLAEYIAQKTEDPKTLFELYLKRMEDTFPGYSWGKEFIEQADKQDWPRWTYILFSNPTFIKHTNGSINLIEVKDYFNLLFEPSDIQVVNQFCHGYLQETKIPKKKERAFVVIAKSYSYNQRYSPNATSKGRLADCLQANLDLEQKSICKDDQIHSCLIRSSNNLRKKLLNQRY